MTLTVKIEEILLKHKKKVFQFVSTASQKHKLYFFLSQKFWQMSHTFTEMMHKDP